MGYCPGATLARDTSEVGELGQHCGSALRLMAAAWQGRLGGGEGRTNLDMDKLAAALSIPVSKPVNTQRRRKRHRVRGKMGRKLIGSSRTDR